MNVRELVVCSLEPWDEVWRRNQYFLDGLLRRNSELRVLLIEPAADPLHDALSRAFHAWVRGCVPCPATEGGCRPCSPPVAAAGRRSTGRRLIDPVGATGGPEVGLSDPVLWVNDPGWAGLLDTGWPAIYDVTDDWVEAERGAREHDRIVAGENRLMAECVVVVVCSTGLQQTKSQIREVELVQNAVDLAAYRTPLPRPADLPGERVVLHVGTLHEDRLDVDLCVRLAQTLAASGDRLVFVGPNALSPANTRRLEASPGIVLLGRRPHTEVPAYLQHADVLLVPHLVDEFTESLDPIKLYEYEAVGRPIAATPVAGFRELAGRPGVVIACAERLPEKIAALLLDLPGAVGPFEPADWSDRVDAMQEILERTVTRD